MQGWTWRAVILGAVITVLLYTVTRPDPETAMISDATPGQLVELLNSNRDVVRRNAAARLLAQGDACIPALADAALNSEDRDLGHIFLVLEDLYVSSDEKTSDAAEEALERLSDCDDREVRHAADHVFQTNSSRRYLRACAKVEAFGGKLLSPTYSQRGADFPYPYEIAVIDANWTGGDDGLKFLRRIRGLNYVHASTDANVSDDALDALATLQLIVRRQRQGCVGLLIRGVAGVGISIRRVAERSPGSRAELQPNDMIVEIAGEYVSTEREYFDAVNARKPGETLDLTILRGNQRIPVAVTLGSDFGTGRCRCEGDDAVEDEVAVNDEEAVREQARFLPTTDRVSPVSHEATHPRYRPFGEHPARGRP